MPSSAPPDDAAAVAAAVERLTGRVVRGLRRGGRGGNNRLYRVDTDAGPLAVKRYLRQDGDSRDRLATEFQALAFLGGHGVTEVARAIAADQAAGLGIYSWIEGEPATARQPGDAARLAGFLGRLAGLADAPDAASLPPASEACLSVAELSAQLDHRLRRLEEEVSGHAGLPGFLAEQLAPAIARARSGADDATPLPMAQRTLSPSDFGTHNAIRRPDGGLAFVDFEYFGWDDPAKLVADTLLHPGMALDPSERREFLAGALAVFGADPDFRRRLEFVAPLYALRWALIVLNPFLPERRARLSFAVGDAGDAVLARQLQKSRLFLATAIDPRSLFIQ